MTIPTEPIGSIPRPDYLVEGLAAFEAGRLSPQRLGELQEMALADTMDRFAETGSPVVTDGEQAKPSFATYPLAGLDTLAPDGVVIPFADGHTRQLPRLTGAPFRYRHYADEYLRNAKEYTRIPVSAVQLDFTEGRLSLKLDPSGGLLRSFVDLNNQVLNRFSDEERKKIGVHTCPGGDQDSVHSQDVDYAELLPMLFELNAGNFYLQLAGEADRRRVLESIRKNHHGGQRIFVGVTDPIDPRVETADEVCERVLEAAEYIPPDRLGTCDDCGFSPFADDTSTSREIAFAKITARVEGTWLAHRTLG